MLTLYDYLPSQNAWKVRLLMHHLGTEYRTVLVPIFDGAGRAAEFAAKNPVGAVPVLELEDGRCLPESNAILLYLAEGTAYLPDDAWLRAQVARWLFFEEDYVQNGLASLRHWTLTGKLAQRGGDSGQARGEHQDAADSEYLARRARLPGRVRLQHRGYGNVCLCRPGRRGGVTVGRLSAGGRLGRTGAPPTRVPRHDVSVFH